MNVQTVNRIINKDKILRDASTKLSTRDSKNRTQRMVFIHSDHFLYFLTCIKGVKVAAIAPDFVQNLIFLYPLFVKEPTRWLFLSPLLFSTTFHIFIMRNKKHRKGYFLL